MKFILIKTVVLAGVLAIMTHAQMAGWSHSATFEINTGTDGAGLEAGETITDFPLLVRLDKGSFDFSAVKANGEDIRFAAADGTPLAHEIELWDPQAGKAVIWVKMNTISGNSIDSILMYWGNSAAASASDPQAKTGPKTTLMAPHMIWTPAIR
jgi:biopolymer transport protein ExbB